MLTELQSGVQPITYDNQNMNVNAITNQQYSYEMVKSIADFLLQRTEFRPKIGIVCGSGLGGLGDLMTNTKVFPYGDIPNFPQSTVTGHKGNLIFGNLNDTPVVCMQGRFHGYEGYPIAMCTMPMKVFKLLGVNVVFLTCAAGGLNQSYEVGDIMLIKDHVAPLMWTLQNPLIGLNDERFGPRFPPANRIYDRELRTVFRQVASDLDIGIKEGVYSSMGGPCYETVSELRGLLSWGADSVGMSTAHEALVATHSGMRVIALSLITNKAVIEYDSDVTPNHAEVIEVANRRAKDVQMLVSEFVKRTGKDLVDNNNN